MKLNKKIYIVKGSEDGNIGVYSNFKKAYEKAVKYIKMGGSQEPKIEYISKSGDLKVKPSTYQGLLRENIYWKKYVNLQKRIN